MVAKIELEPAHSGKTCKKVLYNSYMSTRKMLSSFVTIYNKTCSNGSTSDTYHLYDTNRMSVVLQFCVCFSTVALVKRWNQQSFLQIVQTNDD